WRLNLRWPLVAESCPEPAFQRRSNSTRPRMRERDRQARDPLVSARDERHVDGKPERNRERIVPLPWRRHPDRSRRPPLERYPDRDGPGENRSEQHHIVNTAVD